MNIFNEQIIYNTIFFNIQSVTEYSDTETFEKAEPKKFQIWLQMAKKRYKDEFDIINNDGNMYRRIINELYLTKACFLPEFSKIIAITYATLRLDDGGNLKRNLEKIIGDSEVDLIKEFCTMLDIGFSVTHQARLPIHNLCGHNIIGHDIPLLVKKIIQHREELKDRVHVVPQIVKHFLKAKPWDSNVIDTVNVWKFNGSDYISLNLIGEYMGLKKTVQLLPKEEINQLYWSGIEDDKGSTMKTIELQSINFTNLAIQLVNELRRL